MKLLVVEDEKNVALTLVERLVREGYEVTHAATCSEARVMIGRHFDLVLLDVGLPDGDGFTLADEWTGKGICPRVIFLTAYGDPESRIRGLEAGAKDYVVKPFHLKELLLRIRNALGVQEKSGILKIGRAHLALEKFQLESNGVQHRLTQKEASVLAFLLKRRGEVVTRDEILAAGWSEERDLPTTRTVDNFVMRLRKWIEEDPESPRILLNIRGVGYQLVNSIEGNTP